MEVARKGESPQTDGRSLAQELCHFKRINPFHEVSKASRIDDFNEVDAISRTLSFLFEK